MQLKLGIIGAGLMASAILDRILDTFDVNNTNNNLNLSILKPSQIGIFDIDSKKTEKYKSVVTTFDSLSSLINNSESILIATKPQSFKDLFNNIDLSNVKNVISIMAGIKISSFYEPKFQHCGIIRIMPNMPCKIGKGYSAIAYNSKVDDTAKSLVEYIFSCCGEYDILPEHLFNTVTSVSGSGPAYVYLFAKAMVDAGVLGGLDKNTSRKMALATIKGATELAMSSTEELETLIDNVCSKGGTTIEAIDTFRVNNLEGIIKEGMNNCKTKSEALSNLN